MVQGSNPGGGTRSAPIQISPKVNPASCTMSKDLSSGGGVKWLWYGLNHLPHLAWRLENGYSYTSPPISLLACYGISFPFCTYTLGKQTHRHTKCLQLFMETKLYLVYVSSCGLKYSERDNRTSKMIQGVGSHQPLKMHKKVYWWLETID